MWSLECSIICLILLGIFLKKQRYFWYETSCWAVHVPPSLFTHIAVTSKSANAVSADGNTLKTKLQHNVLLALKIFLILKWGLPAEAIKKNLLVILFSKILEESVQSIQPVNVCWQHVQHGSELNCYCGYEFHWILEALFAIRQPSFALKCILVI